MKFNIEVDATPEEMRRLLGLPDLTEVHEAYLGQMKSVMKNGVSPEMMEGMMRNWMPMGGQGMDVVKDLLGAFTSGGSKSGTRTTGGK